MTFCAGVLVLLIGVSATANSSVPAHYGTAQVRSHQESRADCPVWSGGTGILADGDFSRTTDPGTGFPTYQRGVHFAPDWRVTGRTIDFAGSSAWKQNTGYCSIDLDGTPGPGGIRHSAFATQPNEPYSVTFLFSGNGSCAPTIKSMLVSAANQSTTFTWDITNGNDAQHGVWLPESWTFRANATTTTLAFQSQDAPGNCGPVVAAISVTQV